MNARRRLVLAVAWISAVFVASVVTFKAVGWEDTWAGAIRFVAFAALPIALLMLWPLYREARGEAEHRR